MFATICVMSVGVVEPREWPEEHPVRRFHALEDQVAPILGAINAATAELVEILAQQCAIGFGPGYRDAEHYVVARWGMSPVRARTLVRLAHRRAELPDTIGRLERGEITEDQAGVVARFVTPYRERDVAWAQYATVPQLRTALAKLPVEERRAHGLEPGVSLESHAIDSEEPPEPDPIRLVTFGYGDDGGFWTRINVPADEGALVETGLTAARDELFDAGQQHTSWADALLRLVGAGLDALGGGASDRLPSDRHQVIVHVNGDSPDDTHLHLGPALTAAMRRYLSCDCTLRWVLERHGHPVAKGRRSRTVDPLLRTLVEQRDQTCVVPGCSQRRWLHCHHLQHWEDDGPTDPDNLIALCPRHHRAHHAGGLRITGKPGDLHVAHADGTPLEPLRTSAPEAPLPPAAAGPYEGPRIGERFRLGGPWGWHFGPPPAPNHDPPDSAAA